MTIDEFKVDQKSQTTSTFLKTMEKRKPDTVRKMVKYAAQIFSKRISTVVMTAMATKELIYETVVHTAYFLREIHNIFDFLNRNALDLNSYKSFPTNLFPKKHCRMPKNMLTK